MPPTPAERAAAITRGWKSIEVACEYTADVPISKQFHSTVHIGGDMVAGVTLAIADAIREAVIAETCRCLLIAEQTVSDLHCAGNRAGADKIEAVAAAIKRGLS